MFLLLQLTYDSCLYALLSGDPDCATSTSSSYLDSSTWTTELSPCHRLGSSRPPASGYPGFPYCAIAGGHDLCRGHHDRGCGHGRVRRDPGFGCVCRDLGSGNAVDRRADAGHGPDFCEGKKVNCEK